MQSVLRSQSRNIARRSSGRTLLAAANAVDTFLPVSATLSATLPLKRGIVTVNGVVSRRFFHLGRQLGNKQDKEINDLREEIKRFMQSQNRDSEEVEAQKRKIEAKLKELEDTVAKEQEQSKSESNNSSTKGTKSNDSQNNFFTNTSQGKQNSNSGTNGSGGGPIMPSNQNSQLIQLCIALFLLSYLLDVFTSSQAYQEISWQEFRARFLATGLVDKLIVVNKSIVEVVLRDTGSSGSGSSTNGQTYYFNIGSIDSFEKKLQKAQDELGIAEELRCQVVYTQESNLSHLMVQILPTLLMIAGIVWLTRRSFQASAGLGKGTGAGGSGGGPGGIFGMSKSTAKRFNSDTAVKIKFKDVAGCDEAKVEIMEFVSFLKEPARYEKMGAKIPRGAILSGPPGTGKTLLAKATAGEAGVPFYFVSGSEFVEMFVGVGAARVRDLFKTARENAPSIVFIDEIDAIGKARQKGNISGANDERENTLNQILVEMDGFTPSDHVVVLAGTNRADILDKALMRPGRFDRHINIDKPELEGRKAIFEVYLKKLTLASDIFDLKNRLAALTPGFSGADIANVCNEAALVAARNDSDAVKLEHFEQAVERVIGGLEHKTKLLSPEEKKIVAYHEAGHAICGWFLKYADPLMKVSIIPRGQGALGYAQYLPGDLYLLSEEQLRDRMTMALGGRVSEELHFPSVTSGAADDFKKVTGMATAMVVQMGMSPKIGWLNYTKKDDTDMTKPFSEETADIIDSEVHRIVQECHERCKKLLREHAADVEKVAQFLLRKEVLTREDMINMLGKRPFPERNDAFDKYLNEAETQKLKDQERKHSENKGPESGTEAPSPA